MSIELIALRLGIVKANAYFVADAETKNAVLIDAVDEGDLIVKTATDRGWTIKLMIATHAHFDHVLASARVKELSGAPFLIHSDAAEKLKNLPETGIRFTGHRFPEAAMPDRILTTESETISLDSMTFETLYTPGHAPGHLSLYMPNERVVFSGDALFAGSVGRTDFPEMSHEVLMNSIFDKLMPLDDDVRVFPGHGKPTTIGVERATNSFLLEWQQAQGR